jgi:hypothetical protein
LAGTWLLVQPGHAIAHRYLLREPIGRGGMSVVWRAEDQVLGREVAVKVLSADVAADPASLTRLYAEARAAARLRHDNVVEVYDYGETAIQGTPMPYVVMELVEGRSLSAMLSAGSLPWNVAMLIGAQVAAALAAAHDQGVVHRDVKPANVMVAAGGVKLVDFGISAAVGDHDLVADQIIGTPAYLAPERLMNGTVRPATDVYALGVLLYLMLAGRMPWNASTTTQMLIAHRYREPAALPPVPGLPDEVAALVARCLAKTPSDRPPAVTAARILRQAAGLPPVTLLMSGMTGGTGVPPVEVATEPFTPTVVSVHRRVLAWPVRYRAAAAAALLVAAATVTMLCWPSHAETGTPAAAAATPMTCEVASTTTMVGPGRSTTRVAVTNTARRPAGPWTLTFRLPGGQRLVRGADRSWRQNGETVQAKGRALGAGATASTWFDARFDDVALLPRGFALNDVACRSELFVQGPSAVPTPAKKPRPTSATVTRVAAKAKPGGAAPVVKRPVVKGPAHPPPGKAPAAPPKPHAGPR